MSKPEPVVPVATPPAPPPPTQKPHTKLVHRHHTTHKAEPENTSGGTPASKTTSSTAQGESSVASAGSPEKAPASLLGQLSADDAASPNQNEQTKQLIQETEDRLKKISSELQAKHKEDIVQVNSFLTQAKQAWSMNDVVGAQTLANKAKILLDEILK